MLDLIEESLWHGPCHNTIKAYEQEAMSRLVEKLEEEHIPIDYRLLMAGEYSTFDLYQQYDEEAFGIEPPDSIDYGSIL